MKINIQTKELLRAVNACAKVIQSKNALAILDNVLLSQKDEVFTLTGANADQRYETVLESLMVTEGEFAPLCLPYKILQASLATLSDEVLQIDVKGSKVTVEYDGGEFNISCLDANEYPLAPEIKDGATEFTIGSDEFLSAVKRASVMTANDDLRPIMGGVCLDLLADSLVIVGSDGHRLFKYSMPGIGAGYLKGSAVKVVIPKALVPALENLRTSETLTFRTDGQQMTLFTDQTVITARMIEGKYPNYNVVIPADAPTKLSINVKSFVQSVKRVCVFAGGNNLLVVKIKDGKVLVSTEDIDNGKSSTEQLPVIDHNIAEGMAVGFNYTNLLSCLSNITTDNVTMFIKDANSAVKYKADEKANDPTVMIQMPMLI